jgi:hydrogenase maturation factor
MNGLKIKKIKVMTSFWIGSEDIQNKELDAIILSDGAALIAKDNTYSWIDKSNYREGEDSGELSVKGEISLVGLLGAKPRTINIDFGG